MVSVRQLGGCCAIDNIIGTQEVNDPKEMIKKICNNGRGHDTFDYLTMRAVKNNSLASLATHYIFHGVTEGYGYNPYTSIKNYIRKHKLGMLKESAGVKNRRFHPTHTVKCFIFTPDPAAMMRWWKENR